MTPLVVYWGAAATAPFFLFLFFFWWWWCVCERERRHALPEDRPYLPPHLQRSTRGQVGQARVEPPQVPRAQLRAEGSSGSSSKTNTESSTFISQSGREGGSPGDGGKPT